MLRKLAAFMKKHTIIFLVPVVTLIFCWTLLTDATDDEPGTLEYLELFSQTFDLVQSRYLEPTDPDILAEGAVEGMLLETSHYTALLPASGSSRLIPAHGPAKTGLVIGFQSPMIRIIDVIPGSVAEEKGILPGDSIIRINDKVTPFLTIDRAERILSGSPGDSLELLIQNHLTMDLAELTLEVKPLRQSSGVSITTEKGVRHISFSGDLSGDMIQQVELAITESPETPTILDLRHMNTGSEKAGIRLADLFLEDGKDILTVFNSDETEFNRIASSDGLAFTKTPLTVIIDRTSAGPAETCAAALKTTQRAVVIGEQSFGKAVVTETVQLDDNYRAIMVTGWYGETAGDIFHMNGLEPDLPVQLPINNDADPFLQTASDQFTVI